MNAQEIITALGGKWSGRSGIACCPAHEEKRPSFSVSDGDDGRVLMYCFAQCDYAQIMDALRARGIVPGEPSPEFVPRPKVDTRDQDAQRIHWAQSLWEQGQPLVAGTTAHRYLTEVRGRHLHGAQDLRAVRAIKLGDAWHPGLLAAMRHVATNEVLGVHRTFLAEDATKIERKFAGITKNTAIKLDPLPAGDGQELIIAEGIETALAVRQMIADTPVWAASSAGAIAKFPVPAPDRLKMLTIFADPDGVGLEAARRCAHRYQQRGIRARIIRAADGVSDADDLVAKHD